MEIYTNSKNRKVCLTVPVEPVNDTLSVDIYKDGALVDTIMSLTHEDDMLSFDLPLAYTILEGELEVRWNFIYVENNKNYVYHNSSFVSVVKPILPLETISKMVPNAGAEEVAQLEGSVRHIINAHTGQSFGYGYKTLTVEGHGESALRLPERLVELKGLSTLTAVLENRTAIIVSDGWYLKKGWTEEVEPIVSDNLYFGSETFESADLVAPGFEKIGHGHIIKAPTARGQATTWSDDYPFKITGYWGYREVPAAVTEAARLLVEDYACQEAVYRDRYLKAVKTADWRLDFSDRTWDYTGNVRADQLLAPYVLMDWAII